MRRVILAATMISVFCFPPPVASPDHSVFTSVSQCITCHPRVLPTHKKQTPESMSEDWPLDEGRMSCLTCHNCTNGSCILRRSPPGLCRVCHDCTQGMACMIGSAHPGNSNNMPDFVNDCKTCHNGTLGKEVGGPQDHKVDVPYLSNENFKSIQDKRVVFVDGKVTCVSCHNPYKSTSAKLVKDNASSKLCLTCHNK